MKQVFPRFALGIVVAVCIAVSAAPVSSQQAEAVHALAEVLAQVRSDLQLDAQQEAAWCVAEEATCEARAVMQQDHLRLREHQAADHAQPVNLADLDRKMELRRAQGRLACALARDKWLAVYDSLNTTQQQIAVDALASLLARKAFRLPDLVVLPNAALPFADG